MRKDFENNKALDELFEGFKSVDEIEEEEKATAKEKTEIVEKSEDTQKATKKKEKKENSKKATLFTEVDSIVTEFLDLVTFITGQTKKEYINELVKKDIKTSLNISESATDEQIHKAIENKKKELQKLFRRPSK